VKRLAKQLISCLSVKTGRTSGRLRALRNAGGAGDLTILMYHRVVDDISDSSQLVQPGMALSAATFDAQLRYLKDNHTVISLGEAVRCLKSGDLPPERGAVVTFDDGWRDNYTVAYPILKAHSVPASIFVTTDFIGTGKSFWFVRLGALLERCRDHGAVRGSYNRASEELGLGHRLDSGLSGQGEVFEAAKKLGPEGIERFIWLLSDSTGDAGRESYREMILSWDEIAQMDPDLIEIGSHGCSHGIMTDLDLAAVEKEMRESKRLIKEKLSRRVTSVAYPNGNHNSEIRQLAAECGYECGLAVRDTNTDQNLDLFAFQRIGIHEGMTEGIGGSFSESLFAAAIGRLFK